MKCLFFLPLTFLLLLSSTVSSQNPNMFDFRISCKVQSRACDTMDLFNQAGQIISDNLVLTRRIGVIVIVYQTLDVNKFGDAGPNLVDYTDQDGVSRGYATALVKQLDPNFKWDADDIIMEVNSNRDASFWFPRANSEPIQPDQIDFLEFILHELHHGLGIVTSWGLYSGDHVGVGLIPYLNSYYDGQSGQWTFGGYYENGFDKYLVSMDDNVQITTYTKALNDISGPLERHYKDDDDFFNVLKNVQEEQGKSYTNNMTRYSTTPRKLGFSLGDPGDVDEVILLETSYNPPNGKSIQHLSYNDYYNTPDFLFISDQVPGVSLKDKIDKNGNVPGQGVGPNLMLILETMGYESRLPSTTTKNTKPTRRKLKRTSLQ